MADDLAYGSPHLEGQCVVPGRIIECHPADSIGYLGSHPVRVQFQHHTGPLAWHARCSNARARLTWGASTI